MLTWAVVSWSTPAHNNTLAKDYGVSKARNVQPLRSRRNPSPPWRRSTVPRMVVNALSNCANQNPTIQQRSPLLPVQPVVHSRHTSVTPANHWNQAASLFCWLANIRESVLSCWRWVSPRYCYSNGRRLTNRSVNQIINCVFVSRFFCAQVLSSGLLLVTGPFSLNSCPLRRISQRYVIATQTRVNISKVELPAHVNDAYFKRSEKKTQNRGEGDVFAVKKERYVPSEQKKADQVAVDKAVRAAIAQNKEKKLLFRYLRSYFALSSSQYPHRLRF